MTTFTTLAAFANPFENDNAKYLDPAEVARTFVPIETFWRLFADKNHVVLGTRGSGKTAIAKMMSHDHLSLFDHRLAKQYVSEKRYIGTYAPARLNWISSLNSGDQLHEGAERDHFIVKFNFVMAQAFLATISSCLQAYVKSEDRAAAEYHLVQKILEYWSPGIVGVAPLFSLRDLNRELSAADFRLQRTAARSLYGAENGLTHDMDEALAQSFGTGLAAPVMALRNLVSEVFEIPSSAKFVIAVDEMEFLKTEHHQILNSLLRGDTPGFVFKFITAPYCHYTLATDSRAPLVEGHDFEYLYMDHGRVVDTDDLGFELEGASKRFYFPTALFLKRTAAAGLDVTPGTLSSLLGPSEVLDPFRIEVDDLQEIGRRVIRHSNDETMERISLRLRELESASSREGRADVRRRSSNELFRKMKPAVVLREKVREVVGAKKGTAYSGLAMVIACTDQNPRLLIRTFRMMFPDLPDRLRLRSKRVSSSSQNSILETISERFWSSTFAVPDIGPELADLIGTLGEYFYRKLHVEPIGTDVPGSIEISPDDTRMNDMVHQAVAWGFMYPHFADERRSALPARGGEFRLAYTLCPKFKILPRRGRPVALTSIYSQRRLAF